MKAIMYFAKFLNAFVKLFATQIIYLESPDHPLQNDMYMYIYIFVFIVVASVGRVLNIYDRA